MPDTPQPPDTQPGEKPPGSKLSDFNFKEAVTAIIALAIVLTLVGMLIAGFAYGINDNGKYLIGLALSLAGTVTGYYFGRVPAEARANTAERAADDAKKGQAQAQAKVDDVKKTLDRILPGPPGGGGGGLAALDVTRDVMPGDAAQQELMALRRRM